MDNQAELRISIQTKNGLYQSGDFEKYKYYREQICTLIRLNKKYSLSVGNNLSTEMPQAKHSYIIYLNSSKSPDTSLFFKRVSSHEVSISNNKSHGLCSCLPQLLKCSYDIISPFLANFLNKSVSPGACPSKLKMSKIIHQTKKSFITYPRLIFLIMKNIRMFLNRRTALNFLGYWLMKIYKLERPYS